MSTVPSFAVKLIRRGIPSEELLGDVLSIARQLVTDRLSCHQYDMLGQFSSTTVTRRFGSWNAVLRQLGLRPMHRFHVDPKDALADLRRVAEQLNSQSLLLCDYRRHGRFTTDCLRKLFGPWHHALLAAGLRPVQYRSLTHAELFENLKQVWTTLGRQPRMVDLRPPLSRCTVGPYLTRFKSWTLALHAFEQYRHRGGSFPNPPPSPRRNCVSTHINWRLRYQVLQRDHFRCQTCGRSPATHPGITLQMDHIHPRSQGGPSTLENLQTLCNRCNSGKGDLTPSAPPTPPAAGLLQQPRIHARLDNPVSLKRHAPLSGGDPRTACTADPLRTRPIPPRGEPRDRIQS